MNETGEGELEGSIRGREGLPGERPVILFDGVCALCNTGVDWIRSRDREGRFEFLPYQEAGERFPRLSAERLAQALHVVLPDGRVFAGVDAAPWIFGALPGWSWVARGLGLPGIRALAPRAYAFLARRRRLLGSTATCDSGRTRPSPPPSPP